MTNIRVKRAYEEPDREDGERILVDRLWPRGLTKEKAKVDLWLKDVAPSTELRRLMNPHRPQQADVEDIVQRPSSIDRGGRLLRIALYRRLSTCQW